MSDSISIKAGENSFKNAVPTDIYRLAPGQPVTRFHRLVADILQTHERKSRDYGNDGDALANYRRSERFQVPAFIGILLRMDEKWERVTNLAVRQWKTGEGAAVVDDTLVDTLRDHAVMALIAIQLYEEGKF